jgi:hypothetical protein
MSGSNPEGDGQRTPSSPEGGAPELVQLVIAYAQQEVVDPVVQQGKNLGISLGGALLMAIGTILLSFGFIRALQVEFGGAGRELAQKVYGSVGHLSGTWTWVPYMGAAIFCALVAYYCIRKITQGMSK